MEYGWAANYFELPSSNLQCFLLQSLLIHQTGRLCADGVHRPLRALGPDARDTKVVDSYGFIVTLKGNQIPEGIAESAGKTNETNATIS